MRISAFSLIMPVALSSHTTSASPWDEDVVTGMRGCHTYCSGGLFQNPELLCRNADFYSPFYSISRNLSSRAWTHCTTVSTTSILQYYWWTVFWTIWLKVSILPDLLFEHHTYFWLGHFWHIYDSSLQTPIGTLRLLEKAYSIFSDIFQHWYIYT